MKTSQYTNSIQKQLTRNIFSVILITFVIGYSVFVSWYLNKQKEDNIKLAENVTKVISQDMAKFVLLNDVSVGADITSKLKTFKKIKSIILFNKDKIPIYQYSQNNKIFKIDKFTKNKYQQENNVLKVFNSVKYEGMKVGYIEFHLKIETLLDILKDDLLVLIGLFIFILLISYFLALIYSKQFTKPILNLVDFLEKIEFEDIKSLKKKIKIIYDNEFGKLYEEINILLEKLLDFINQQKISSVAFETKSGMVITDKNMIVLKVNKSYEQITGYSQKEVIGKKIPLFKDNKLAYKIINYLKQYNYWNGEIKHLNKKNQMLIAYLTIQPVFNEDKITNFVFSFIDVTKQKEMEEKLKYLKQYDSLTGFLNKEYFLKFLKKEIGNKYYQALFYLKISNLKVINSIYGFTYGDIILKQISDRLKNELNDINIIGKIGINDFILYYSNLGNDKQKAILKIKTIIEMIEALFMKPFEIDDKKVKVEIIIGINLFKQRNDEVTLLKETNIALQTARESLKKIAFFDKNIEIQVKENFNIYEDMIIALKENQFELYYQLQYDDKENIYGAEALIRWNHPSRGLISPIQFIPIAEKTDLIVDIGNWVLNEACKQIKIFSENIKTKNWIIAVNVSVKQFKKDNFILQVINSIKKHKINPKNLKIELLESLFVDDVELVIEKMNELKKLGIKLSLDDFGTGFSSLQYLKNFPLDQIKIDQSFVRNMFNNEKDIKIIKSIVYLGESLGIDVIAEGVEEKGHYEQLKKLGCRYYQGYYFAKPEPIRYINENIIQKLV